MEKLLSTKEVAQMLSVNEKMVYTLITDKGLPATKITGKWLFPSHLVEQWVENMTINYPSGTADLPQKPGLLMLAGSNDILLDQTLSLFMRLNTGYVALFGALGSMGGLKALRRGLCHIATSHLAEENDKEYNFAHAADELEALPAVVNFCQREQGLIVARSNPLGIEGCADIGSKNLTVINRRLGTSTRIIFDRELEKAGLKPTKINGYGHEVDRHLDIGLEILAGRADIGPDIRAAAELLGLDFLPLRWERFDLLIPKDFFFERGIQIFLALLHEKPFHDLAEGLTGYDLSLSGRMLYPGESR
jgi:excisionase family DNA binding protein